MATLKTVIQYSILSLDHINQTRKRKEILKMPEKITTALQ